MKDIFEESLHIYYKVMKWQKMYTHTHTHTHKHTHNVIILSHKKEQNWVICVDVDEPRVCQREVSQKEENKYHTWTTFYNHHTHHFMHLMTSVDFAFALWLL